MTPPPLYRIWVYLAETPLLWLTATLIAFGIGDAISARLGRHPLANPVVIAAGLLIALLTATRTPYVTYFQGAQFVHFLLGPATVALGLPLWRNRVAVRRNFLPMVVALLQHAARIPLLAPLARFVRLAHRRSPWEARAWLALPLLWLAMVAERGLFVLVLHPPWQHVYSDMEGYVDRGWRLSHCDP